MDDLITNFDNTIIKDYNGILLSKDEIDVLRKYDIHFENYTSMKQLIYEIEDVISDLSDATDLEEVSLNLSERDYYQNTNK